MTAPTKDQVNKSAGFNIITPDGDIDREQVFALMKSAKEQVLSPPPTISIEDGVRMSETITLLGSLLLAVLLINDMYVAAMEKRMPDGPPPTIN